MNNPLQPLNVSGGSHRKDNLNINQTAQMGNAPAWADYGRLLESRYIAGGLSMETALRFARGEINAVLAGNHYGRNADGKIQQTPADPQRLILEALLPDERERFSERAAIMEHDGGMSRADAEAGALHEIINGKYPAPVEKPRNVYRSSDAVKQALAAGIGIKPFFAKGRDSDRDAYFTDRRQIAALWNDGQRRFKAFVRGKFLVIDIDRKPDKPDGLKTFYQMFPKDTLPAELQNLPDSFPVFTKTPLRGFHLFFKYEGPELKLRELAPSVEIKEWQISCPGSRRKDGEYILHGELSDAPPLYGLIIDAIEEAKRKKEQAKTERLKPKTKAVADRPMQFTQPRITLDDLANEAASAYSGHHDRQVSFAGRACRCKFSGADALAYVKSRPDIFGNDADTKSTVLSVFRDNGGCL